MAGVNDVPARRPGGAARFLLLVATAWGFFEIFWIGFPAASRDRLPVLAVALALALLSAWNREKGLVAFAFLFPLAGLGDRVCGGADAIAWPILLFCGMAAGWTFRFLYDFESAPDPSPADGTLRGLLAVWSLATLLALVEARTLWAELRGLTLRAVNVDGMRDAAAIRTSLLSFAALAAGAGFFFLLRRAGAAARARALSAALAGIAASAAVAVAGRGGLAAETSGYWRQLGRFSGGAIDPNALGILCGLGAVAAAARTAAAGGRRLVGAALTLLLAAAGLVLSGSRSGVVLAAVGFAALLFARGLPGRRRAAAALAGAALVAAIAFLRLSDTRGSAGERLLSAFDPRIPIEFRASARPLLWSSAMQLFAERPVAGAGLGAFSWQLPNLLRARGRSLPINDNPGNAYVQALAETGAIGFALTLAFVLVLARESWRALRDPEATAARAGGGAAALGFLVALATGSHWFAPDAALGFFLLAAVAVGAAPSADGGRAGRRVRGILVAVYAVAAAWAMLGTLGPERAFAYRQQIGFHEEEVGPGGPYRWTARRFAVRVLPGGTERLTLAHFTPEGRGVELAAEAGGRTVFSRKLAPGEAVGLALHAGAGGPRIIRFALSRAFVPQRLGVSGDRRELGLLAIFPP